MSRREERRAKIQGKILSAYVDRFMVAIDQSNESADSIAKNASNLEGELHTACPMDRGDVFQSIGLEKKGVLWMEKEMGL